MRDGMGMPSLRNVEMNLPALHVVGDSISIHYGPYLQTMLVDVMSYSRKTAPDGNLDDTSAANGGDSSMVLDYLRALQPDRPFDLLLINCGLHDIKRDVTTHTVQVPSDRYETNLREILAQAQRLAACTIWVCTTPVIDERHNRLNTTFHRFEADVEAYNAAADRIMREHDITTLDLFTFTRNLGPDVYADHVHFTDEVRAQQAAFIAGCLSNVIARSVLRDEAISSLSGDCFVPRSDTSSSRQSRRQT
jgi:lysophospholipase L1-like esterase